MGRLMANHSRCCILRVLRSLHIQMVSVMVFNATFNNISVLTCRSVLLVEETTDISTRFELTTSVVIMH